MFCELRAAEAPGGKGKGGKGRYSLIAGVITPEGEVLEEHER